ncbi:hypothetical protein F4808DRAFT_430893 [Astrocystis sublimbata]|nr:hypothetical protein F4808DRAFT_430893 [Astrocystis sublimbata]
MATRQYQDFRWNGEPLPDEAQVPEDFDDCIDGVQITAWILKHLLKCSSHLSRVCLNENKDIARLFQPKTLIAKDRITEADWDIQTSAHATAITYYLFTLKANSEDCRQCCSRISSGPCVECVSGKLLIMKGACSNCYYSSNGFRCSLREGMLYCICNNPNPNVGVTSGTLTYICIGLEHEQRVRAEQLQRAAQLQIDEQRERAERAEKREELWLRERAEACKTRPQFTGFSKDDLKKATNEQLVNWRDWLDLVEDEIREREKTLHQALSALTRTKKRRLE